MNEAADREKRVKSLPEPGNKLAYSIEEFAGLVSISPNQLRRHISGEVLPQLVPSYSGRKAVIPRSEGERWLELLPTEPVAS